MIYDVVISGAGIVGLASALKILEQNPGVKLAIVEKENDVALHQTSHNSGVIHSGIYYRPGSLKADNCIKGYRYLIDFCKTHGIEYEICGKVIVATDEREIIGLEELHRRGTENGLNKIRFIDKHEIVKHEPHCRGLKAIFVPYTGIVDFRKVALKYCEIVKRNAEVILNEKVIQLKQKSDCIEVITPGNTYVSRLFINCCGLYSDEIASLSGIDPEVKIMPFRGEYYRLKEEKKYLVKNLIYPVPDPEFPFLGVHFTRTIHGVIEAGPNAVLAFSKEGYRKNSVNIRDLFSILSWKGFYAISSKYFKTGMGEFYRSLVKEAFVKSLRKLIPEIKSDDLIYHGAGVRAQAVSRDGRLIDDFLIKSKNRVINVLNAPSPAATSSLAIGEKISEITFNFLNKI